MSYRPVTTGDTLGRYVLGQELGSGGMATVYRARDTELRRHVAIKVLFQHLCKSAEVVARFAREARASAALDHRHILKVFDVGGDVDGAHGTMADPPFIVLELVSGPTLEQFANKADPPLAEVVAAIGCVVAEALEHAHSAGIIHRDVKPANLLWDDGRLVLADFGVARVLDDDASLVTRTGSVLGTPSFMSPEQATAGEVDHRSDLYSLGAALYWLSTGSLPASGNPAKAATTIAAGEVVPPLRRRPAIGRELARIIEKLMALEPEDRYSDASEVRQVLLELVEDGGADRAEALVEEYAADPAACDRRLLPIVISKTTDRARSFVDDGQTASALALVDRVLTLDPGNQTAGELMTRLAPSGRGRWIVGALLASAVAGVLAFQWLLRGSSPSSVPRDGSTEVVAAADRTDASVEGFSDAAVVLQPVGPTLADAAPAAVNIRRPPQGNIAPKKQPDAGVAPAIPADARPIETPPLAMGTVRVVPDTWCNLLVDGQAKGQIRTEIEFKLPVGRHQFVCEQPGLARWKDTVIVTAGATTPVRSLLLPDVRVTISVAGGDAIRIDGRGFSPSATLSLRPGRHRVDVLKSGKIRQSKYISIPRVSSCTLRDQPQLGCFQ